MSKSGQRARGAGRPPKFTGPARVVTMTLPEATLAALDALDGDRARAVVRATDIAGAALREAPDTVEMLAVGRDLALLVLPFSRLLAGIEGLRLVQIQPARYLVVLEPGLPLAEVELALIDTLDLLPETEARERSILTALLEQLRSFRRSRRSTTGELILVAI